VVARTVTTAAAADTSCEMPDDSTSRGQVILYVIHNGIYFFNSYVQNDKTLILYVIHFCRYWVRVLAGAHNRKPNGILGHLCWLHFPGLVMHAGVLEPAYTWDHFMASPDATDREGRNFATKARRVVGELWVSHPRIKIVEISHSVSIFEMMIAIILWVYM